MKRVLLAAAAMMVLSACIGPIDYLNTTARKARRSVAEAESANAEKLSPYEYWSAVVYLRMAREKAGHADWQDAWKYGRKADEMGGLAKKMATEKGQAGPNATGTAPTEDVTEDPPAQPAAKPEGQPPVKIVPAEGGQQ